MKILQVWLILITFIVLTACGGGGGNASSSGSSTDNSGLTGGDSAGGGGGQIDLVDFVFNDSLDAVGGMDIFDTTNFNAVTGEATPVDTVTAVRTSGSTITETGFIGTNTITIAGDTIVQVDEEFGDVFTFTTQRFPNIGDTISTDVNIFEGDRGTRTCLLDARLDSFDIGVATSPLNITSGTFFDVLRVSCTLEIDFMDIPNSIQNFTIYYARGVGFILSFNDLGFDFTSFTLRERL